MTDDHRKGPLLMTIGLLVQFAILKFFPVEPDLARQIAGFVAGALLVYGGALTASSKGHSPYLGLLGLFSFIGMGILLLIPHRHRKVAQPEKDASSDEPPAPLAGGASEAEGV